MIENIGIDIVENKRVNLRQNFLNKVLTKDELEKLSTLSSKKAKIEFVAGRWAVKESIIKTLKNNEVLPMSKINIGYLEKTPIILNKGLTNILISISHEKKYSVGMAVKKND
ncbi:Holo-[acyl-carrier protein] synthase [Mesoplasma florum W37]|uniref:Holo-[acyl-carrier protein] synthase n=1 Tax=Mesoplasma florum TaxID=2151 RepID=A0AAD0MNA0_MESFO|nr:4'-phosphopantetheinyl transferase superfamily protein [Mesoplasma florum]AGY41473.1 Holo-[acyl-carrier protein] synthase [Mesoplasma florum W37]AVN59690.1 ACP synthase [Mesoplasma florum]AVN65813.1 Holo-[acyl-carrier protein] synthase [Mesoplasma florum]